MYIESRFYDNGRVKIKLHKTRPFIMSNDKYDAYIDKYNTLTELVNDLGDCDNHLTQVLSNLHVGKLVDITDFC